MRITVTYQLVWNLEWPGRWVSEHACGGIILIGSGPGLQLWGKRPLGPHFPVHLKDGAVFRSQSVSLLPADLGKGPQALPPSSILPSDPQTLTGSLEVSFPKTGPDSTQRRRQHPGELPCAHQFGSNI